MEMLNGFLREKKAPGRLRIFEGGHRWPPEYLCWEALEWMLIRAVRKEKTEAGILDRVWDNRTERARASEKKGNTFKAYKEYLFFARDFEGIRDTGEIRKKVEKLGALPDVQERLKQEEEKRKKREVYRKKVGETVNTICRLFNDDPEKTRSIIDELKGIIKKNEDEIEALYARAVLIQLAAHSRSGARYLVNKKYDEAIFHLKLALLVYPKERSILYNIACAYSRKGDEQNGLRYLEKSVENGFTNIDHMERDPDLEPLRKTEGYKNVIKRLKKSG
jgi:tetratricopeptide (TPR) repeat protein